MDTSNQSLLRPGAAPISPLPLTEARPLTVVPPAPEMNRAERAAFTAYLVMIAVIVAAMAVTSLVALL
jgi:hypothetical protein